MKVSLNWLREFVDLNGVNPQEIGEKLTLHTCELEEIIAVSKQFQNIVTGKVVSITRHNESDKLMKAEIDTGSHGKRSILFGETLAVSEAQIVPVALPGAVLPGGMKIESKTIAGEKSEGMICVNSELGYKNDFLLSFPPETPLGVSLSEAESGFSDVLFDIDNKSLTHRPDMWGIRGFFRELSALYDRPKNLENFSAPKAKTDNPYPVKIKTKACNRFCALKMTNISVKPSVIKTQIRLENLGIRAISNLVDITNLILLEYGQPMHVFDADKVKGSLIIRQAEKGESLVALDEETYELEPSDIVIADEEKVLSIAGIMGGLESAVTEDTTDIIFESANFDAATIRRTSSRLGLRSESSMRFEKSLDPENAEPALWKAVSLVQKQCPESVLQTPLQSVYPSKPKSKVLSLHPDKVRALSGIDISDQEIIRLLESVDFKILSQKYALEIEVPSFRATKDIEMEEDLIEEVVRLYGFDTIPTQVPCLPLEHPRKNHLRDLEWNVRDFFAHQGFLEVMHYSFVNKQDQKFTGRTDYIDVQNPLSSEQSHLRVTLLSNILKNLESELRTHKKLSYFEIGKVFHKTDNPLPLQKTHLGVLMGEISKKENDLFFALKDRFDEFFQFLGLSFQVQPFQNPPVYAHPAKTADMVIDDESVGSIFVLHPGKNDIKQSAIVFAELDLEKIQTILGNQKDSYTQLSPYPSMLRDISILVPKKALFNEITARMKDCSPYLKQVQLFDEFFDAQKFGADKKNMAFHLTFGARDRTLTDTEVEQEFQNIVKSLGSSFGAELRLS